MVHVEGNATTGYAGNGLEHVDLPQPALTRVAHRPWCTDCKRKHDADQLNTDGRCEKCARAAVSRAEAESRRAERAEEIKALEKAAQAAVTGQAKKKAEVVRRVAVATPRLPKEVQQGQPTTRPHQTVHRQDPVGAPGTVLPTGFDALLSNAIEALTALHSAITQTPAAATSTPAAAGPTVSAAPSPVAETAPTTSAGHREGEARARRSTTTGHDPRRIVLPADQVIAAYRAGQTLAQIAETHGVSHPTVRRCLIDNNEPRRRTPVDYTPELIDQVRHMYDVEHLTQVEIAQRLGRSTKVVQTLMTTAGVDRRAAQARQAADNSRGLKDRIAELGVSVAELRAWGRANGHTVPDRGLVARTVVEAYATAHQHTSTANPTGDTAA